MSVKDLYSAEIWVQPAPPSRRREGQGRKHHYAVLRGHAQFNHSREQQRNMRRLPPRFELPQINITPVIRAIKDFWESVEIESIEEHEDGPIIMKAKRGG